MSQTAEQFVTPAVIDEGINYQTYRTMIDELLKEGKTTGTNHSEAMIREMKQQEHPDKKKWIEKIQKWYAKDRTEKIQSEFEELLEEWTRLT